MRAQRAKLKSQRDDMMVAQGKRSATLGCRRKIISSFFLLVFRTGSAENQKEKRDGMGLPFTQGGSRLAPLPWAIVLLPLWGDGKANKPAKLNAGTASVGNRTPLTRRR
jgi:hypothetical protein